MKDEKTEPGIEGEDAATAAETQAPKMGSWQERRRTR